MTVHELLTYLTEQKVKLWVEGNRIRYRAPKDVVSHAIRNSLIQHKEELLVLMRKRAAESVSFYPLSYGQRALFFLNQIAPESAAYNCAFPVRILSTIDITALKSAFQALMDRHAVLRTTYCLKDGNPHQVTHGSLNLAFEQINAEGWSDEEITVRVHQKYAEPINLEKGPILRVHLFTRSADDHVLLITAHHIACDVWSFGILIKELQEFYRAKVMNNEVELPAIRFQFSDYVQQQTEMIEGEEGAKQLAYWEKHLSGDLPVLSLPTDFQYPPVQQFKGASNYFLLEEEIYRGIEMLGRDENVTMYVILLAAFQTLLMRYSGQKDILVGTPMVGRNRTEYESIIGYFINPEVMRGDLSGDPTFREYLVRVSETFLNALNNQDYPFPLLVERLQPARDPSRSPVFQAMFNMYKWRMMVTDTEILNDSTSDEPVNHGKLKIKPFEMDQQEGQFDLVLEMIDTEQSLDGTLKYSTDLFTAETITRMVEHFRTLLKGIVADPGQRLSELSILTEDERDQLLVEWNATEDEYPGEVCLHELFEKQVERTPQAVAVVFEGQRMSYGELNGRANQVAHRLQALGVGPEKLVGIYIERSLEMVVGLLGILKAGGAYVPLDPAFPKERLEYMIEDAHISVLLTQERLLNDLPAHSAEVLLLDADWDRVLSEDIDNPDSGVTAENLVYVIYTSGSTGKPKGVQITHRAVVNFLFSMLKEPGLTEQDIFLSVTTLSFDIAALELYLPLITGAQTVLVSREVASDGKLLLKHLVEYSASVMQATPSTWRLMLEAGWNDQVRLKILCGGEALPRELANQLLERGGSLWNMYGPTETTIWSSVEKVESMDGPVVIGPPIANTQFYILGPNLQPVPIGVSGELHIGGDGLARGYLNRPELTRKQFIDNPFSDEQGCRLYKTGDLVRYLPDGHIEFLGRFDHQVKVRGFRIELGEIEEVLSDHPIVREVVVVAQEAASVDTRLVAYIVPSKKQDSTVSILRDYLKEKLPEYMVPSLFMMLEKFPLTPNGKIDRKKLPKPDVIKPEREYAAPRDQLELVLTSIWQKILSVKPIGIKDNFFELGGHSLLAARLFAQIEKTIGKNIPLATLLQAPTIKQIADIIRQKDWKPTWSSLVPIQTDGSKPPLFLIHGAEGNVLLYRELTHHLGKDQPVYGLQSEGLDGKKDLQTRLKTMAAHYIKEIRSIQPEGTYYLGGYCLGGTIAFEMAQQLHAQGQEVGLLAMFETYNIKANENPLPNYFKVYHILQLIKFQFDNLFSLRSKDKLRYLKYKLQVELSRLKLSINVCISKIAYKLNHNFGLSYPHVLIKKVNDQAQLEYLPKTYAGRITLFRPKKYLAGFNDPQYGWGGLVKKGVDIHELPLSPRGMLVEPFVQILADKVKACIYKVSETESA